MGGFTRTRRSIKFERPPINPAEAANTMVQTYRINAIPADNKLGSLCHRIISVRDIVHVKGVLVFAGYGL